MLEQLKSEVYEQNLRLVEANLVVLTWGNVSGYDPNSKLLTIKPSGVSYDKMKPEDMVVLDLDGNVVEGKLKPSSDTPTHIEIYKKYGDVGIQGIAHTHSVEATAWAQAKREIPCYGTTHADQAYGPIPCTRILKKEDVEEAYEKNTGKVILEYFEDKDISAQPGILVAGHAPFTWGATAKAAVDNSIALEKIAQMARYTEMNAQGKAEELPQYVADKHYYRKHGKDAYYGQN